MHREAQGEELAGGQAGRIAQHSTESRELGRVTRTRTGLGRSRRKAERTLSSLRVVSRAALPELGPRWRQMWQLWNLTGEGGVAVGRQAQPRLGHKDGDC